MRSRLSSRLSTRSLIWLSSPLMECSSSALTVGAEPSASHGISTQHPAGTRGHHVPLTFHPCPRGAGAAPRPVLGAGAACASCSCMRSPGLDGDAVNEGWDLLVLIHPEGAQNGTKTPSKGAPLGQKWGTGIPGPPCHGLALTGMGSHPCRGCSPGRRYCCRRGWRTTSQHLQHCRAETPSCCKSPSLQKALR